MRNIYIIAIIIATVLIAGPASACVQQDHQITIHPTRCVPPTVWFSATGTHGMSPLPQPVFTVFTTGINRSDYHTSFWYQYRKQGTTSWVTFSEVPQGWSDTIGWHFTKGVYDIRLNVRKDLSGDPCTTASFTRYNYIVVR